MVNTRCNKYALNLEISLFAVVPPNTYNSEGVWEGWTMSIQLVKLIGVQRKDVPRDSCSSEID